MTDKKPFLTIYEIVIFGMLGGVMYVSKQLMEFLPNVHLIAMFVVALTVVYRFKALFPIYVFILLTGMFNGFSLWWYPYLYLWLVLWAATMLLPKKMNKKIAPFVYMAVAGLHGYCYGTLYAPYQALVFHLNFKQTLAWIAAGLPWDAVHGTSNLIVGILIVPLITVLRLCEKQFNQRNQ